jgi:hypothetical protein
MGKTDKQFERIEAIIGDGHADFDQAVGRFAKHLKAHLQLPCEVTGSEDFRWEEPYVFGGWSAREYARLKKTQPSYTDRYQLLDIDEKIHSEWALCHGEDIGAHVQRTSDGKKFVLALSELKTTDTKSPNSQLLDDFAVFFANYR